MFHNIIGLSRITNFYRLASVVASDEASRRGADLPELWSRDVWRPIDMFSCFHSLNLSESKVKTVSTKLMKIHRNGN